VFRQQLVCIGELQRFLESVSRWLLTKFGI